MAASLHFDFAPCRGGWDPASEPTAVRALYNRLQASSFAADVLAARPSNLAVLPVTGVRWSDWGRPERVLSTLAGLGIRPEWAARVAAMAV